MVDWNFRHKVSLYRPSCRNNLRFNNPGPSVTTTCEVTAFFFHLPQKQTQTSRICNTFWCGCYLASRIGRQTNKSRTNLPSVSRCCPGWNHKAPVNDTMMKIYNRLVVVRRRLCISWWLILCSISWHSAHSFIINLYRAYYIFSIVSFSTAVCTCVHVCVCVCVRVGVPRLERESGWAQLSRRQ